MPSDLLQLLAGLATVVAVHVPVALALGLVLNRSRLPAGLRPGIPASVLLGFAGIAYAALTFVYVLDLVGVRILA